jgi:hypothetical protein
MTPGEADSGDGGASMPGEPDPDSDGSSGGGGGDGDTNVDGSVGGEAGASDESGSEPEEISELVIPDWMPDGLFEQWKAEYLAAGGNGVEGAAAIATQRVRASAEYETYFPGIKREDGSIRFAGANPEQQYMANIAAFRNTVQDLLDINPDLFTQEYVDLIEGDVSPREFTTRANALYTRVMEAGDAIRQWYADAHGIDVTNSAILASLMSRRVEEAVFNREITMAEIGGTASQYNFAITDQFVDMLADNGMDRERAQRLFGTAEGLLPMLGALAGRHGDADDTFDIEELAASTEFYDPYQTARMRRLEAQEASAFTGGAAIDYRRNERGGVSGLNEL